MTTGDAASSGSASGTVCPTSLPLARSAGGYASCGLGSQSQLGNFLGSLLKPIAQAGTAGLARKICAASGGPASGKINPNTLLIIGAGVLAVVVIFGMRGR